MLAIIKMLFLLGIQVAVLLALLQPQKAFSFSKLKCVPHRLVFLNIPTDYFLVVFGKRRSIRTIKI